MDQPILLQLSAQIIDAYGNFDAVALISFIKGIMIFISIVLAVLLVIISYKLRKLVGNKVQQVVGEITPPKEGISRYESQWQDIKSHINSPNDSEWKFAIIEADKLVDEVLRSAGFAGDTMGERLMAIEPGDIANLDGLWKAHKVRNSLAHNVSFTLQHRDAVDALNAFEVILRGLGAID